MTDRGNGVTVLPMSSTFVGSILELVWRIVIGPRRTPAERRVTLVGGLLGAVLASAIGLLFLGWGYLSDPFWQRFPPPIEPFLLLPIPGGLLAGLRFTTELTRPDRVSWRRLLAISAGAQFVAVGTITVLALAGWEVLTQSPDGGAILQVLIASALLAVVWSVFPGFIVVPALVPAVALFAFILRRLSHRRPPVSAFGAPSALVGR